MVLMTYMLAFPAHRGGILNSPDIPITAPHPLGPIIWLFVMLNDLAVVNRNDRRGRFLRDRLRSALSWRGIRVRSDPRACLFGRRQTVLGPGRLPQTKTLRLTLAKLRLEMRVHLVVRRMLKVGVGEFELGREHLPRRARAGNRSGVAGIVRRVGGAWWGGVAVLVHVRAVRDGHDRWRWVYGVPGQRGRGAEGGCFRLRVRHLLWRGDTGVDRRCGGLWGLVGGRCTFLLDFMLTRRGLEAWLRHAGRESERCCRKVVPGDVVHRCDGRDRAAVVCTIDACNVARTR